MTALRSDELVFSATVPHAGAGGVTSDAFRATMATLPTAVSVVTTVDGDGVPRGLTCSAVCSLSAEPAQILVCINSRSGSLAAIRQRRMFAVNMLHEQAHSVSDRFASPTAGKFPDGAWQVSPDTGLPLLAADATAIMECDLLADIRSGTHVILIGGVRSVRTADEPALADEPSAPMTRDSPDAQVRPLLYWRRAYGRLHRSVDC